MFPNCPVCGGELPEGTPAGRCPNCLIGLGLDAAAQVASSDSLNESREPLGSSRGPHQSLPLRLGGYELLERIGQGGMGVVYKARQISLNRLVALKTLPFGSDVTRQQVHRFRIEAVAAGALQHPNIVAVHEVGLEDGVHYLVMDYVEGSTLARLTRAGPLPVSRAVRYARQIAAAVQFAHDRGILHRDLKPSNVLVDASDQPRITDFGLAKTLGSNFGLQTSSLTLSGQALGSPGYIPPEQASGKRGQASRQSDVYGLGALLYHLVTGRPPFQADGLEATLQQVFHQEPVSPRLLNPSVPRDVETICLKCLEKEPQRRYQSAHEVAEVLDRVLENEPIRARPIGVAGKAWRWCRRKPVVASLSAAIALLLLGLAVAGPLVAAHQRALAERYRKFSYAAELSAAWQAWDVGNVERCMDLLDHHRPSPGQSDLREFTWRLLWHLCQPARDTPQAINPAPVLLSAVSPDGQRFALSGPLGSASIWNAASRQLERKIDTGEAFAGGVAFSHDGRLLVTTGRSGGNTDPPGRFRVWDIRTGAKVFERDFANEQGHAGAFSPDGQWFALDLKTDIALLDVEQRWQERRRLQGHTGVIWQIGWSPNGAKLVSASQDRTARVWDAITGHEVARLEGHSDVVRNAVFSPDGKIIATGSLDGTLRLWSAETFTGLEHPYQPSGPVMGLAFSNHGRWLAVGSHFDGLVTLIDLQAQVQRTLRAQFRSVKAVLFVLGDTVLVTAGLDQTIRFWDLTKQPPGEALQQPAKRWSPVVFAPKGPKGELIVTISTNGTKLLFWDVATGACQSELDLRGDSSSPEPAEAGSDSPVEASVQDFAFLPDGTLVVARVIGLGGPATNLQHRIELHDLRRKVLLDSFPGRPPIACSPDGRRIASQGVEKGSVQLRLLAAPGGTSPDSPASVPAWVGEQQDRPAKWRNVWALAFSPEGTILAVSGLTDRVEGELVLIDPSSGRQLAALVSSTPIQPPTYALAFMPGGARLVTGGLGTKVQFWDVANGALVDEWVGHSAYITALAISPDGKTLATGSGKGLIKLWSLEQRAELLTLPAHERSVDALRFSSGGQVLASSGQDGRVRLWRAPAMP